MMYNLLTTGNGVLARIAPVLAGVFGVAVDSVDVCDADDYDSRNWDASVSCEYAKLTGDLSWSLAISTGEEVDSRPSEELVAKTVAQALDIAVVFSADYKEIPWIDRVAVPSGNVAHLYATQWEDDPNGWTVNSVEISVREFPCADVRNFPEIIKPIQLATPITDDYVPVGHPEREACWPLVNWERLCVRMTEDWPPSSWYPASMYVEDLELRDRIDDVVERLSPENRTPVLEAFERVDRIYRELTVDDGGVELATAAGISADQLSGKPWYWRRRPAEPPWNRKRG